MFAGLDVKQSIEKMENNCQGFMEGIWYLRNKSWKPECVVSFNMGWRILVFYHELLLRVTINNNCSFKFNPHAKTFLWAIVCNTSMHD